MKKVGSKLASISQEEAMKKRIFIIVSAFFLCLLCAVYAFAQYTGFDLEKAKPPRLLPTIGAGDRAIISQLQETNRRLEQNNRLLVDQNRLLRELITQNRGQTK